MRVSKHWHTDRITSKSCSRRRRALLRVLSQTPSGRASRTSCRTATNEGQTSGGHALVDSSGCRTEFDVDQGSRAHGRDDSSGNFRRRVSVSHSPWRGAVRSILREARTSRCIARYGYRGTRVGESAHPGPTRRLRRVADAQTWSPDCPHRRRLSTTVIPTRCLFCVNLFHSTGSMDWSTMSLTAMLFCLKCSSCQTEVCTERRVRSVTPQRDHHAGWCWSHIHQVPHHRTVSGREPGGGVETHNRFSPLQDTQQEGRPIMESQRVRYRE